jgi:ABC-2 type transport system permease protein
MNSRSWLEPAGILAETVHAEWTKLRTVRTTAWLLVTAVVLTVGISAIAVSVVKCPASCTADTTKTSLTGVLLGQAIVAVLAVLIMSGEYSTGMIRATITATPRRLVLLSAKAIILTAVVLAVAAISVLGSLLAGRIFLPHNGFTKAADFVPLAMYHGPTLRAAVGSVLYLGLIALFSLGVATAVRDSGVALTVMLGLIYVVPILAGLVFSVRWQHFIDRYAPTSAGLAVQVTKDLAAQPIGPWAGLGVLAAWTAAALLIGGLLLKLRDA